MEKLKNGHTLEKHRSKAVENHVNGAVWAFDYDKMFC